MLKNTPDDRLRAYIVWLPMFPGDSRGWAKTRSDEFSDRRLSYYWDGDKRAGQQWQKVLGTSKEAWDVYLLYGAQSQWDKQPPVPSLPDDVVTRTRDKYLDAFSRLTGADLA